MPKFFLHVRDGSRLICDPDGEHFRDVETARVGAIESARQLMAHSIVAGKGIGIERCIEIADETGETVLIVPFQEAVKPGH